jgi:hypothetical protein
VCEGDGTGRNEGDAGGWRNEGKGGEVGGGRTAKRRREAAGGGRTADPQAVVGVAARVVGTGARID